MIKTNEELHGKISGAGSVRGGTSSRVLYTDAYNLACMNGFEGTLEEWLESLKGEPGFTSTDETLILKDGVLSVNTTNDMEQDNTLPITSAGVYATVGNIEALLKTI